MDILPEPDDAVPGISVPVAQLSLRYDGQDFRSFGDRHGFSCETAGTLSPDEIASHLQSWLFFGLLSAVLGGDSDMEDFICVPDIEPSRRCLSLKNLPARFSCLQETWDRVDEIRDYCFFAADSISEMEAVGRLNASPAAETGLAVYILARSLLTLTYPDGPAPEEDTTFSWNSTFLRRHMKEAGWCPQQIASIIDMYDPLVACFLARLRRPGMLSHTSCTDTACVANNVGLNSSYRQRHAVDGCRCENVAVNTDEVRRVIRRGGIPLISIECQNDGRIGLAVTEATPRCTYTALSHVWSDGLGNPAANAVPRCQLEMLSGCLSRSPGLDVDRVGGLFCGVHIQSLEEQPSSALGSTKSSMFWLDTLCIPVAPPDSPPSVVEDFNTEKMMAINTMAQIYAMATQVLVLDSELQRIRADTPSPANDIEILARLSCCSWMRRCWTLQEGAMADNLIFRCANGVGIPLLPLRRKRAALDIVPGPALYVKAWGMIRDTIPVGIAWKTFRDVARKDPITAHLRFRLQEPLSLEAELLRRGNAGHRVFGQASPESQLDSFCRVWNSLIYRNTTMAEDLVAVFANLLDLSAYHILQLPSRDRMLAVLRSLEVLPVDILFNTGPRKFASLDIRNRWVPSEPSHVRMVGSKGSFTGWNSPSVGFTAIGDALKVDYTGRLRWTKANHLELTSMRRNGIGFFVFQANTLKDIESVSFVTYSESENGKEAAPLLVHLHYPDADAMQQGTFEEALLLDMRLYADGSGWHRRARGCLLRMTNQSEGKSQFTCRYNCPVSFEKPSDQDLEKYPVAVPTRVLHDFVLTIECGELNLWSHHVRNVANGSIRSG